MSAKFDPRIHFALDCPSDYSCSHCNRVLLSPVVDKQGKLLCKSCAKLTSVTVTTVVPHVFRKQLDHTELQCVHCRTAVELCHAQSHIQNDCREVSRTMKERVQLASFNVLESVGQQDSVYLISEGADHWYKLSNLLHLDEVGIVMQGGLFATNYGRLIYNVNSIQGVVYATNCADNKPLPINIQYAVQRMHLSIYLASPDVFVQHMTALVMSSEVARAELASGV